jgi:RimJ/RimL family protein N-acetyltransferase
MIFDKNYDCILHTKYQNIEYIKGPIVDLRLISFYNEHLTDDIPFYWFDILVGNHPVGKISLRLGYNQSTLVNGHVGYEVDPDYQGHRYSYYALEMIKDLARLHGFEYLLITTSIDNLASQKTIMQASGEIILSDYQIPKDHIFYVMGKPNVNVYEIKLGDI